MSKKKKSEGLFEAISKAPDDQHGSSMRVPDWIYKKPEQPADEKQAEPPIPPKTKPPKTKAPVKADEPQEPKCPIIVIDKANERMTVTLNFVSWSVAALAALVVLIGTFTLGRMSAPDPAPGPTEPYRPDVLERQDTDTPPAQPPATSGRVSGKYYMIVQSLGGVTEQHWKQAEQIAKFCKDAGKPVSINRMHSPDQYIIWSLAAFDTPDSTKAVEYALSIETLGKKYKEKYTTHNFKQTAPGGRWPWFVAHRQATPTN